MLKGGWGEGTKWKEVPCIRLEKKTFNASLWLRKGEPKVHSWQTGSHLWQRDQLVPDHWPSPWPCGHPQDTDDSTVSLSIILEGWGTPSKRWSKRPVAPSCSSVPMQLAAGVYCSAGVRGPGASGCETDKAKSLPDAHTPLACNLDNSGRDVSRHPRGVGLVVIIISFVCL